MELKGQVIIVTGGASGIGKETARALARKGADLVIADYVPMDSVVSVQSEKVTFDCRKLDARLRAAIGHDAHDAERL